MGINAFSQIVRFRTTSSSNVHRPAAPSGEWNDDDHDVLANGEVVGRIFKLNAGRNEVARETVSTEELGMEPEAPAFITPKGSSPCWGLLRLQSLRYLLRRRPRPLAGGGQVTAPSGQNSGAGIPGKPGSKSGPAAKPSSETTGSDMSDHNRAVRQQDSSKIPGQPGSKSGPSIRPPSEAK
jgi:hypothetical protein